MKRKPADWEWMRRAVDLAKKCTAEPNRAMPPPKVGAVLIKDGSVMAEAFRGEKRPGDHAEFCLLQAVPDSVDLRGAVLYTTLEPCTQRNHPKIPCAQRLANRGIGEVVIGIYDPNPKIYRIGWKILRDAGTRLRDFPAELRQEICADNEGFLAQFRRAVSTARGVSFDYTKNDGKFVVGPPKSKVTTRWSSAGHNVIHALDYENHVAVARYAQEFNEIDQPDALDFSSYTQTVRTGEIVVFRNAAGAHALVKVVSVLNRRHGDEYDELRIEYEIRPR
jgi:diaminohydroxyphosphoribosylaminopyrimidine deaminase/5-amino-6-(5-phosphoribosylamino)uracil reductase